jgi:ribonuclease-3
VLDVEGPPRERRFVCAALVDGEELGRGTGRTTKAEQAAAKLALETHASAA